MTAEEYQAIILTLIDLIDEGVYITDRNGIGLFYNANMEDLEKISQKDVIGQDLRTAFPGVEVSRSTMYNALRHNVETRDKVQSYMNLYGKEVTTVNNTMPVKVHGETIAAIEVAQDITEMRSMSDQIRKLSVTDEQMAHGSRNRPEMPRYIFDSLVGTDPLYARVIRQAKQASRSDANVLITGESGTGKELFAQSIHNAGPRSRAPFLSQHCDSLSPALLDEILFGTAEGAYPGAVAKPGLFEQANGGTLMLDQITGTSEETQGKLLRVAQDGFVRRIGGVEDIPVDVRIIATANIPPDQVLASGKIKEDLYYRLLVIHIHLPTLRERVSDIPKLARHFLKKYSDELHKPLQSISQEAMDALLKYDYPGNVRELDNIIHNSVVMSDGERVLDTNLLQMPKPVTVINQDIRGWNQMQPLSEYLAELEQEVIHRTLMVREWNISQTAEELGMKRQTLQHKIKKYGLQDRSIY